MWETETSIEVQATQEAVYERQADLRQHKEWSVGVEQIEQTTGDGIEVGAEFKAVETVPARFTSYSRITRLERHGMIEWRSWDGRMMEVDWTFELSAGPHDGTRVVQRARFRPTNLMGQIVVRVMRRRANTPRENAESLQRFKAAIEPQESPTLSRAV